MAVHPVAASRTAGHHSVEVGLGVLVTIYVNFDLDHSVWIVLPPFWGGASWRDEQQWADEVAKARLNDFGVPHRKEDLARLSALLVGGAQRWGPGGAHPEREVDPRLEITTVLHHPDPYAIPMPVRVLVVPPAPAGGEMPSLLDLAMADDPLAPSEVHIEERKNPNLGIGLRALRHRPLYPESGGTGDQSLYALLRYTFPVPGHADVVLMEAAWPDLGRLAGALDDIDAVAAGLSFEHHP